MVGSGLAVSSRVCVLHHAEDRDHQTCRTADVQTIRPLTNTLFYQQGASGTGSPSAGPNSPSPASHSPPLQQQPVSPPSPPSSRGKTGSGRVLDHPWAQNRTVWYGSWRPFRSAKAEGSCRGGLGPGSWMNVKVLQRSLRSSAASSFPSLWTVNDGQRTHGPLLEWDGHGATFPQKVGRLFLTQSRSHV